MRKSKTVDSDDVKPSRPTRRRPRRRSVATVCTTRKTGDAPRALAPQRPLSNSVERRHLIGRLCEERGASVVALTAPPGYGKSILLDQWAQRDGRRFVWLETARCGNTPAGLLEVLATAIGDAAGEAQRPPLVDGRSDLGSAGRFRPSSGLAELAEAAGSIGPTVLVLDDADRIRSRESLELLADLARIVPPELELVISSRAEPKIGLARLRAANELLQLRASELAMTAYEARTLLAAIGTNMDQAGIERLTDRSEGWPVAIYLAGLALRGRGQATDAELLSIEHAVAQYIEEELLSCLAPKARTLLRRTSVLDELSGEVCDATLANEGNGQLLREIADSGMMLTPLDESHTWYRLHTMLREVLQAELEVQEPAQIARVHDRASAWFAARGELDRAIEHAVAAGDATTTGCLLWDHAEHLLYGRDEQVQQWLTGLPVDAVASSPRTALAAAHTSLALGDLTAARHWARIGEDALAPNGTGADRSLVAAGELVELFAGTGGPEAVAAGTERLQQRLGRGLGPMRPLTSALRGTALILTGEDEMARRELGEAVAACTGVLPWLEALSLAEIAILDIAAEDWAQVRNDTEEASERLIEHGLERSPVAVLVYAAAALVMSKLGMADEAKRELLRGSELLGSLHNFVPWYEVQTRVTMARASTRLADVARARSLLSQASRGARRPQPVPSLLRWIDEAWAEIDDASAAALSGPGSLTMAELRVLRFLPTHLSFREIGERLHVSGNTVKSQAHAIYAKLGASSRSEAVAHASALGLIDAAVV
jgi:LuxR family transcriptional regulator, maltose regulon positive regulatory protein